MSFIGITGRTALPLLGKIMDLSTAKQRAYAENMANVNTPDYKRLEVKFSDELSRTGNNPSRIATTHPGHIGSGTAKEPVPEMYEDPATGDRGVDVEKEMVSLAENQLRFNFTARLAALKIAGLRTSIRGTP